MHTHTYARTLVASLHMPPHVCVYVSGGGAFSKQNLLQAGKAAGCAGCPNQSACASGAGREEDPAVAAVHEKLVGVKHKVRKGRPNLGRSKQYRESEKEGRYVGC